MRRRTRSDAPRLHRSTAPTTNATIQHGSGVVEQPPVISGDSHVGERATAHSATSSVASSVRCRVSPGTISKYIVDVAAAASGARFSQLGTVRPA
jgi:hypothetical protein